MGRVLDRHDALEHADKSLFENAVNSLLGQYWATAHALLENGGSFGEGLRLSSAHIGAFDGIWDHESRGGLCSRALGGEVIEVWDGVIDEIEAKELEDLTLGILSYRSLAFLWIVIVISSELRVKLDLTVDKVLVNLFLVLFVEMDDGHITRRMVEDTRSHDHLSEKLSIFMAKLSGIISVLLVNMSEPLLVVKARKLPRGSGVADSEKMVLGIERFVDSGKDKGRGTDKRL